MVHYRRYRVQGGTYFFTVTLRDRQSKLLTENIHLLRSAWRDAHQEEPWETAAVVVMPDHLHTIWQMPDGDHDFSGRWKAIKSKFVRRLKRQGNTVSYNERREADIWQSRFWEHAIRDDLDLQRHIDYIHFNPVKHGLVSRVVDWPWSSFHRYVRQGILPEDWGGGVTAFHEGFGE